MSAQHSEDFSEKFYQRCPLFKHVRDERVAYSDDKTERSYTIYDRKFNRLCAFRARRLPGCCGVLVIYYLRPTTTKERAAIAVFQKTLEWIRLAAGDAKYGAILLSQVVGSAGYEALEAARMANQASDLTNHRTKNRLRVYLIETIPPKEPKAPKARPNFSADEEEN